MQCLNSYDLKTLIRRWESILFLLEDVDPAKYIELAHRLWMVYSKIKRVDRTPEIIAIHKRVSAKSKSHQAVQRRRDMKALGVWPKSRNSSPESKARYMKRAKPWRKENNTVEEWEGFKSRRVQFYAKHKERLNAELRTKRMIIRVLGA